MSFVDSWPSTVTRSKERLTHTPSSSSAVSGESSASVSTKHSIVAKRGEIMPAPLHWALRRTLPDGSSTSRLARFSKRVGRLDRALEGARRRSRRAARARRRMPFSDRVHGQVVADRAGRGERHLGLGDARGGGRGALRLGGVFEAAPAGRGVRAAGVGEHRAQRRRSRQRSRVSSTGAAAALERGEARGAHGRLLGVADEQADVGAPLGFSPAATPAARKPAGRPASSASSRTCAGAAPSASGRRARCRHALTAAPSSPGRPNIRFRFWTACEEVPFQRLSMRGEHEHLAGVLVGGGEEAAVVRLAHLAHPGRRVHDLDERLVRVGVGEQLAAAPRRSTARVGRDVAAGHLALVERHEVGLELDARRPAPSAARAAPRSPACAGARRPCRGGCSRPPSRGGWSRRRSRPAPEMPCLASITTSAISARARERRERQQRRGRVAAGVGDDARAARSRSR